LWAPALQAQGGHKGRPYGIRAIVPALMFIVVCGRSRRIMLSLHAKFSGHCKFIVFCNERFWSAP
jgi:hypothetical protein